VEFCNKILEHSSKKGAVCMVARKENDKGNQHIGDFIRERREGRGLSQIELAYISGLSTTLISKLENGHRSGFTVITVAKLERSLKVPTGTIFRMLATGTPLGRNIGRGG